MKVIIAGPRNYSNYQFIEKNVLDLVSRYDDIEIVEGGAKGVDSCAYMISNKHCYNHKRFCAEWNKYGKMAGPMRNEKMAKYADMLIAFRYVNHPSRGTENMIKKALYCGLIIHIIPIYDKEY